MAMGLRFVDIGANLADPVFRGIYRGAAKHADDFAQVLERAWKTGLEKIIVTAGSLSDVKQALELCKDNERLFTTVGVHPTRCMELEEGQDAYMNELLDLANTHRGKIVAVGECGLDWERVQFCAKEVQLKWFEAQFVLAERTGLPMFLHMRACAAEELEILTRNRHRFCGGVVHSFDDTAETAKQIVDLGLYIGLNGCSLRTAESLEVIRTIPRERLLLETDAPWCDIRPTHPGFKHVRTQFPAKKMEKFEMGAHVKGRNEPANIVQVCEVVAAARGESAEDVAAYTYENTMRLFFPSSSPASSS